VKRVLLDGIDGLLKAAVYPDRLTHFLTAVTNELRLQGATTMYSVELPDLFSTQVALPMQGISSLLENVFLFRFVEQNSELRRLFTIVKLRDSNYDGTLRELRITSHGAELAEPLGSETSGTTGKSARSLGKVGATKAASRKRRLKLRARKA
jgi:circadian clock protein KaiC